MLLTGCSTVQYICRHSIEILYILVAQRDAKLSNSKLEVRKNCLSGHQCAHFFVKIGVVGDQASNFFEPLTLTENT